MDITSPFAAMTVIYWLHMLATVVWIGGLSSLVLLVIPAAQRALDPPAFARFLEALQRRLDPLGWFCLIVLVGTGMFQMSENPNYAGFLTIDTTWAAAILLKHVIFFVMTGISAYLTWGLLPVLRRTALKLAQGMPVLEAERLNKRNIFMIRLNLALAVIVLLLTALARAS